MAGFGTGCASHISPFLQLGLTLVVVLHLYFGCTGYELMIIATVCPEPTIGIEVTSTPWLMTSFISWPLLVLKENGDPFFFRIQIFHSNFLKLDFQPT